VKLAKLARADKNQGHKQAGAYATMVEAKINRGLERVRHQLRASGLATSGPNALRTGVHTRGYLPHVKREGASYFVTFRLADSLPREVLLEFKAQQARRLSPLGPATQVTREHAERELQRQIERYLDRGMGECHLKIAAVANMVSEALLFFHQKQYLLDDRVIMPNHVHLILWPMSNYTLSGILQSRKRHTARQANIILGRTGEAFWQPESYDHWIRNEDEKARIRRYIRNNPLNAGLCRSPEDWPWSSAHFANRRTADYQSATQPTTSRRYAIVDSQSDPQPVTGRRCEHAHGIITR
jgi:REP element-mobilizing transposase RayT